MIFDVRISKRAENDLRRVPLFIQIKFRNWVRAVLLEGLEVVRKRPGFHDEPLKGVRSGQRSIRLNWSYRAIYEVDADGCIEFVRILEVNKHDY
ncbi:type II toxin-antitoxin system RelE family toxin [Bdellovibrio sp. HCB274]|uniref:type II toxin-antitoxin system RelE family toxin n=1 Tax=Bdellovibrio sp. HCB274 TaxID=3394361 RepID=UPI0039B44F39